LLVAKIRERLQVSKRPVSKVDMDRFNLKKLIEGEVKEQYQVTIKNRFSALENVENNGDINWAWDAIRENIKISAKECIGHCEAKRHKPWFDEECLKLVNRRKQAKLQWLQDPSVVNEDNLSNVKREASRHFRNKKREYFIIIFHQEFRPGWPVSVSALISSNSLLGGRPGRPFPFGL
jgi:hypothetical protein